MKKVMLGIVIAVIAMMIFSEFHHSSIVMVDAYHHDHEGIIVGGFSAIFSALIGLAVAVLLAFIFVGVGLFVLGVMVFVGGVVFIALFPMFLPLIIPLFIIWLIVAAFNFNKNSDRNSKKTGNKKEAGSNYLGQEKG